LAGPESTSQQPLLSPYTGEPATLIDGRLCVAEDGDDVDDICIYLVTLP